MRGGRYFSNPLATRGGFGLPRFKSPNIQPLQNNWNDNQDRDIQIIDTLEPKNTTRPLMRSLLGPSDEGTQRSWSSNMPPVGNDYNSELSNEWRQIPNASFPDWSAPNQNNQNKNLPSNQQDGFTRRSEPSIMTSTTFSKPILYSDTPPLDQHNQQQGTKVPETNITFKFEEFEEIARSILDRYGFRSYLSTNSLKDWYLRFVEHARTFNNKLTNCLDVIVRDHASPTVQIPLQPGSQESSPFLWQKYYGSDYLSVVFRASDGNNSSGQGPNVGSSLESKFKTMATPLQSVLQDPANGSSTIPSKMQSLLLFPDTSKQVHDRNEEIALKDKWNPLNCDIPFPIFVRHIQWRLENYKTKEPLPHFNVEIFKLRYAEHLAQAEKNNKALILGIVTAYGADVSSYPLRVMQILKRNDLFGMDSTLANADFGNNNKAFISIIPQQNESGSSENSSPKPRALLPFPVPSALSSIPSQSSGLLGKNPTSGLLGRNPNPLNTTQNAKRDFATAFNPEPPPRPKTYVQNSIPAFRRGPLLPQPDIFHPIPNSKALFKFSLPQPPKLSLLDHHSNINEPFNPFPPPRDSIQDALDDTKVLRNPINPNKAMKKRLDLIKTDNTSNYQPGGQGQNSGNFNWTTNPFRPAGPPKPPPPPLLDDFNRQAFRNQFNPPRFGFDQRMNNSFNNNDIPLNGNNNEMLPSLMGNRNRMSPPQPPRLNPEPSNNSFNRFLNEGYSTGPPPSEPPRPPFQLPFDIWRVVCERSRSKMHNPQLSAPLRPLTEQEYEQWYARYLYYVEENYDRFMEGIMSGFPEPIYPREIRDMITHRQLMEEGECDRFRAIPNNLKARANTNNFETGPSNFGAGPNNFGARPNYFGHGPNNFEDSNQGYNNEFNDNYNYEEEEESVVFDYSHMPSGPESDGAVPRIRVGFNPPDNYDNGNSFKRLRF